MKRFWSGRIRDMVPYVPGEQPRDCVLIKLNTNENPYPPSPRVQTAIAQAADVSLRLYPDPECLALRKTIGEQYNLPPEFVFCGNGSDEVLSFAFQAFFDKENPITFPDITYSFYEVYVRYLDLTVKLIPLNDDFSLPVERFLAEPTGGVVIANPNAPTGQALGVDDLRAIVERHPNHVVIIDEAYVDFGATSMAQWVTTYPNLLVVQTSSKSRSLAGARVAWALGDPNLMAAMRCVRDSINSYTVDRLASAAAIAALEDKSYFDQTRQAIQETREQTWTRLRALGFEGPRSDSNFLFVHHPKRAGKALYGGLRQKGILVRRWDLPRIEDYLRISVGTPEEMDALCAALAELIESRPLYAPVQE